jgi:hypothetical protein
MMVLAWVVLRTAQRYVPGLWHHNATAVRGSDESQGEGCGSGNASRST